MFIPDTGPLWSFAVVDQLDLLGCRLRDNVQWTSAVHAEVVRNARGEPKLWNVIQQDWLPDPVDLSALGLDEDVFATRASLASSGDHPRMHLGEAESIVYANYMGAATFVTGDGEASRRAQFAGVHVVDVIHVLQEMEAFGDGSRDEIWGVYAAMVKAGRLPPTMTKATLFS